MTTVTTTPSYERQLSIESGWDNPFQPDGDLSREADEIVNLIRGGKPITPTESVSKEITQPIEKINSVRTLNGALSQTEKNGIKSHQSNLKETTVESAGQPSLGHISKQVIPGPASASHVVINEKKNKKKNCCTLL